MCAPVNASPAVLPPPAHDSGLVRFATPLLRGSFIRYSLPALTGAFSDPIVRQHFPIAADGLCRHGRSAGRPKIVAVELACRLTELSQRAIGKHYGGIGSAAVSTIHRKVREGKHDMGQPLAAVLRKLNFKGRGRDRPYGRPPAQIRT